jgi:predicted nucleotidyltransferase
MNTGLELIDRIDEKILTPDYDFLRKEPLGENIILLGLGGSYAYGTNIETSDIDIRGIATHSAGDILTRGGFEQVTDEKTDTVIYSLEKIFNLLSNCNPNTIEMLGLEPWQYIYVSDVCKRLIQNADMFLSRRVVHSFGGYATAQLRRLDNKAVRTVKQAKREAHILASIENAKYTFPDKYFSYPEDAISLYIDDSPQEEYDTEIFMDINLKHYPLRDYKSMWSEMHNIVKDYNKLGKRNRNAIEHGKIAKHMMHLVRLYLMAFDILEQGKIITYRRKDHDFLMSIRNGDYIDENNQPKKEFYDIVDEYDDRLNYLKDHNDLPPKPDYDRIRKFLIDVNASIVFDDGVERLVNRMKRGELY